MTTFVALFRGINVGGKNILPMKKLRDLLRGLGCAEVKTSIQSGNAVFRHSEISPPRLAERISAAVHSCCGFEPAVQLMTADRLEKAVRSNPFPDATSDPSKLHLFFLAAVPEEPDLEAVDEIKAAGERFALIGDVAYLHAPDGIARSRLAARVERLLGEAATARNWRSVARILDLARSD